MYRNVLQAPDFPTLFLTENHGWKGSLLLQDGPSNSMVAIDGHEVAPRTVGQNQGNRGVGLSGLFPVDGDGDVPGVRLPDQESYVRDWKRSYDPWLAGQDLLGLLDIVVGPQEVEDLWYLRVPSDVGRRGHVFTTTQTPTFLKRNATGEGLGGGRPSPVD